MQLPRGDLADAVRSNVNDFDNAGAARLNEIVKRLYFWIYRAANACSWVENRSAYFVIPTIVNTLVKCGDNPNA